MAEKQDSKDTKDLKDTKDPKKSGADVTAAEEWTGGPVGPYFGEYALDGAGPRLPAIAPKDLVFPKPSQPPKEEVTDRIQYVKECLNK